MSDFDIIDNNEFTKPKNYKNTNNSSSSEVYNKFDIFKNSENESENEIIESENEIIESENESESNNESESDSNNIKEPVIVKVTKKRERKKKN